MRLLDTDIMVDILRGYQPAIEWFESLDAAPGLVGLVVMELMEGCRDKSEMLNLRRGVEFFRIYWPTQQDCDRALRTFSDGRLSHGISIPDALIAECALGLNAVLCTFNTKHFHAVPALNTEKPYLKS